MDARAQCVRRRLAEARGQGPRGAPSAAAAAAAAGYRCAAQEWGRGRLTAEALTFPSYFVT